MKTCFDCKRRQIGKDLCSKGLFQDETMRDSLAGGWAERCPLFTYTPNTANHYRRGIERMMGEGE